MIERALFPRRELDRVPIALADADLEMRSIVRGMLNTIGARRVAAIHGIARFKELRGDEVAMMVIHMDPAGIGSGFCRAIRWHQTPIERGIPIIGYARNPTIDIVRKSLMAGLDEFLAAPFTTQALSARIDAVLDRPKPLIANSGYVGPDHSKFLKSLGEFLSRKDALAGR